ncbi:MAG: TlpA family protein disulfide reductase, partial [Phycisphaerae bacterium]|nr:TlpA family protein disulfide reductase [Phycisphaerae bacterium]
GEDSLSVSDQARNLLEQTAAAYRAVPGLQDRMSLEVKIPQQDPEIIQIDYAFGPGADSFVSFRDFAATARGDQVFVVRSAVTDKFLQVPLKGDLPTTLADVFGQSANLPAPFEMRANRGVDAYVKALGMNLLQNPKLTGHEEIVKPSGQRRHQLTITATNGTGVVLVDPETLLIDTLTLSATPPQAPPEYVIDAAMRFTPQVKKNPAGLISFDRGERHAVTSLQQLTPTAIAVGSPAPNFTLATLDGDSVPLSSLRGKVVVLDFWATWCRPCIRGLPLLQEFANWAESSGQPVAVYAVDTFERARTDEAKVAATRKFWTSQGFSMPTLLDLDSQVAERYGVRSIPMTFVIGPDGNVAAIHRGYDAKIAERLQADVAEILADQG